MGDPRDETRTHGPSWWDVGRLTEEIQTRHDVSVSISLIPHTEKGRGITAWMVYVGARPPKRLNDAVIQGASYFFRGNRGASTITAALFWALTELNEKLITRGGQAALPGF